MNPFAGLETSSDASDDIKLERAKTSNKGANQTKTKAKATTASTSAGKLPVSGDEIKQRQNKDIAQQKEKKTMQKKINSMPSSALKGVKSGPLAEAIGNNKPRRGREGHERQSGTGRGKEVSKGGAGAANWGSNDGKKVLDDETAGEEIAKAEAAEENVEVTEEVDEGPAKMTLDQYEALKKSQRSGKGFEVLKTRAPESNVSGKLYRKEKDADETQVLIKISQEASKPKKSSDDKKEKKVIQRIDFIGLPTGPKKERNYEERRSGPRFNDGEVRSERRTERGGRGGFRGGRGSSRGGAIINSNDESAFPKLGA